MTTYRDSGVDIDAGDEFVDRICLNRQNEASDLKLFNFSQVKLKHVYQVWRLLNKIYLESYNKNTV